MGRLVGLMMAAEEIRGDPSDGGVGDHRQHGEPSTGAAVGGADPQANQASFDSDLSEYRITDLGFDLSPRDQPVDKERVRELMPLVGLLNPIVVFHAPATPSTPAKLLIVDGTHRTLAHRLSKHDTILGRRFVGTYDDARREAIRSNTRHGRKLTRAERERAVTTVLDLTPDWSNRRVAEVVGLSPHTVADVRKRIYGQTAEVSTYVGSDGRRVPPRARLRELIREEIEEHPDLSNRAVARKLMTTHVTVSDVRKAMAAEQVAAQTAAQASAHPTAPAGLGSPAGGKPGALAATPAVAEDPRDGSGDSGDLLDEALAQSGLLAWLRGFEIPQETWAARVARHRPERGSTLVDYHREQVKMWQERLSQLEGDWALDDAEAEAAEICS